MLRISPMMSDLVHSPQTKVTSPSMMASEILKLISLIHHNFFAEETARTPDSDSPFPRHTTAPSALRTVTGSPNISHINRYSPVRFVTLYFGYAVEECLSGRVCPPFCGCANHWTLSDTSESSTYNGNLAGQHCCVHCDKSINQTSRTSKSHGHSTPGSLKHPSRKFSRRL